MNPYEDGPESARIEWEQQQEVKALREMVRSYVIAASRMRDHWSESDKSGQDGLWSGLHGLGAKARKLLGEDS